MKNVCIIVWFIPMFLVAACSTIDNNQPERIEPDVMHLAHDNTVDTVVLSNMPDWEMFQEKNKAGVSLESTSLGGSQKFGDSFEYPEYIGNSKIPFDLQIPPFESYIVADRGESLDVYRDNTEGDLIIELEVRSYLGDTYRLLENDLIGESAILVIPNFDIDSKTRVRIDCDNDGADDFINEEMDVVYFNDKRLGVLTGDNNQWDMDTFKVPLTYINFPNTPGEKATNTIRIVIDVLNKDVQLSSGKRGCPAWRTEVDWAGLMIPSSAFPMFTAMGTSANIADHVWNLSTKWEDEITSLGLLNYTSNMSSFGVGSYCHFTEKGKSLHRASENIRGQISQQANLWGQSIFHMAGYSKGGPNVRQFLHDLDRRPIWVTTGMMNGQPVRKQLQISTFTAIGATFAGSPLASFTANAYLFNGITDDFCDQRVSTMTDLMEELSIPGVPMYLLAGNADTNGDHVLDDDEGIGFDVIGGADFGATKNLLYAISLSMHDIRIDWETLDIVGKIYDNDIVTRFDSAWNSFSTKEVYRAHIEGQDHITLMRDYADEIINTSSTLLEWRRNK